MRLTVAQAVVKFLGAQYSESHGVEQKLLGGVQQRRPPELSTSPRWTRSSTPG
jgi:hypothetical protein